MIETSPSELIKLFEGRFWNMLDTDWSSWRDAYLQQVRNVQEADENTWSHPRFQQILWDDPSISSIGPGQSVITSHSVRRICMEAGSQKWPFSRIVTALLSWILFSPTKAVLAAWSKKMPLKPGLPTSS